MRTKVEFLLLAFMLFGASSVTSSEVKQIDLKLSPFTKIEVNSSFDVTYVVSNSYRVVYRTNVDVVDNVVCRVVGEELHLYVKNDFGKLRIKNLEAIIYAPSLREIELNGASTFNAGNTKIEGLESIDLSGASSFQSAVMQSTTKLELDLSGASSLKANFNVQKLDAEVSGASYLLLSGVVKQADVELSGASKAKLLKFNIENANIDISGASYIEVAVSLMLNVEASGASTVLYLGNPKMSVETSGASSVKNFQ